MEIILLIIGLLLGAVLTISDKKKRQLQRVPITNERPHQEENVSILPKEKPKLEEQQPHSCDLCEGETELYLAGQKINCPKCEAIKIKAAQG